MEIRVCPNCKNVAINDIFCRKCGIQMEKQEIGLVSSAASQCPRCHADISPKDNYCGNCRAKLPHSPPPRAL